MTKEEAQACVDEVNAVCQKHNVKLIGTCISEGIYGEILIHRGSKWQEVEAQATNRIFTDHDDYYVSGIG
jgi:hypothetical protein